MKSTSDLYKSLLAKPAKHELVLEIAGVEYGESNIVSCSTSGGLFQGLSIGNAAARQIDLQILPLETIPRQAQINVYTRLTDGLDTSENIPCGVFFVSQRNTDKRTGVMTIRGFDAMLKAEETWLNSDYDEESWPMDAEYAVNDIATRMGVEIDSRTVLNPLFSVGYPVNTDGDITMREALKKIAVANAGNWCITDEGKLLLVPLNSAPAETNYLVTESGAAITLGGVCLLV